MFGIGTQELIILLFIILLLFGGKKLPELSRSIGDAMRQFKKGLSAEADEPRQEKSSTKSKK